MEVSFLYGPEHQRIRETSSRTVGGVTTRKTLNVLHPDNEGGLYFEREDKTVGSVSSSENRHYISAEKGAFLLITSTNAIQSNPVATAQTGAEQRYWHKDHLGSIVASTNASGGVIERMAYDPFGKRRHIGGQFDQAGTIDASSTSRGFTGHEHLDELDFIHMNARVYDPDIGKFLSADPKITYVHNPQGFNRYAYTQNNPLNFVDPDGFDKWSSTAPTATADSGIWNNSTSGVSNGDTGKNDLANGNVKGPTEPKGLKNQGSVGFVSSIDKSQSTIAWGKTHQQIADARNRNSALLSGVTYSLVPGTGLPDGLGQLKAGNVALGLAMTAGELPGLKVGSAAVDGARLITREASVAAKGMPADAQFAQKTYGKMFSKDGAFAGRSVDDVAAALRSGAMKPSEIPVDYIVRDGRAVILNTRSSQALDAAGIARSEWNAVNRTGTLEFESRLTNQLSRNPNGPFDTVRRSGGQ